MVAHVCGPLIRLAALTIYLVVNVGVGTLHHHHDRQSQSESSAQDATGQFRSGEAPDDGDEAHCLLCKVLHLARILTAPCSVEASTLLTDEACPPAARSPFAPLRSASQARAPPVR